MVTIKIRYYRHFRENNRIPTQNLQKSKARQQRQRLHMNIVSLNAIIARTLVDKTKKDKKGDFLRAR